MNRDNPFRADWQEHLAQSMRYAAAQESNVEALRRILREAGATEEEITHLEREGREGGQAFVERIVAQQPQPHLVVPDA